METTTKTPTTNQIAKAFEKAVRAALAVSKANTDHVKHTTRAYPVEGYEGWKVRYSWAHSRSGYTIPQFNLTGPAGKTAHASTGRLAECCLTAVKRGEGVPVDTGFITVFA